MSKKIFMTLALLLTAATGAWAADTYTITFSGFGNENCNKTVTDATLEYSETFNVTDVDANFMTLNYVDGSNDYVSISNSQDETQITITVKSAFEGTENVTVDYVNGDGDQSQSVISVTCVKSAPSGPDVIINDDKSEASFNMPQYDVTATYTIKRDMTVDVAGEMADRIRIQKDGNDYQAVYATQMNPVVKDNLETNSPVTLTVTTDYTLQLQKQSETNADEWTDATALSVGTFRYKITGAGNYSGICYSEEFALFEGYEVTIPAGEYITYYRDEPLKLDDTDKETIELYTIRAVGTETATLSGPYDAMKAHTPMLVHNKNTEEAKTILLIPCNEPDLALTVAPEFKGTLVATEIAASSATSNNYAFNGKQFVWVKDAIEVAANKAWLEVGTPNSARTVTLVFDNTTRIDGANISDALDGDYYDLNGRKLQGKPTKKGIYIKNGRKVVVK